MAKKNKDQTSDKITTGMKISLEINVLNNSGTLENILFLTSIVEKILDDDSMLIQMPMYKGNYYPLHEDNVISMHFFLEPLMYELAVRFQEQLWIDNLPYAKVMCVSNIHSYQRRDCYRLPCSFPVTIEQIQEQDNESQPQAFEGQTINFSDSGMLFSTDAILEEGTNINLTFNIGTTETVKAVIFRITPSTGWKYKYKVAVHFIGISEEAAQKNRFYKYIVGKQMEERRRQMEQ